MYHILQDHTSRFGSWAKQKEARSEKRRRNKNSKNEQQTKLEARGRLDFCGKWKNQCSLTKVQTLLEKSPAETQTGWVLLGLRNLHLEH